MNPVGLKVGAALTYAQNVLGGPLVENDSNPTVGTSVVSIADGNGDRVALVIVNLGTNNVFVSPTSDVSGTNGIQLTGGGGSVAMNVVEDFTFPSRQWWAIAPGGNSMVYVLELVRFSLNP